MNMICRGPRFLALRSGRGIHHRLGDHRQRQRCAASERLDDDQADGRAGRCGAHPDREPRPSPGLPDERGDRALPQRCAEQAVCAPARIGCAVCLHDRHGGLLPRGPAGRRDGFGTKCPGGLQEREERLDLGADQPAAVGDHHRSVVFHHAFDGPRRRGRRRRRHHECGQGQGAGFRQGQFEARDVQGRGRTRGGQGRDHGDRRFPQEGRQIQGAGCQDPEGGAARGPSGNR